MSAEKFTPDMIWKSRSIIQECLDLQKIIGWSDAETLRIMACYLSDALEATQKELGSAMANRIVDPIITVRDGKTERHVFLGNAAREMHEALMAAEVILRLSNHDFSTNDSGKFRNITLRSTHKEVLAAIAKAEGRS
jgi:hypothetical protein